MTVHEMNLSLGKRIAPDTVRIERILPGSPERLWSYLVDADKRRLWFAGGEMEPRAGGKATFVFNHSTFAGEPTPERFKAMDCGDVRTNLEIVAFDPPKLLSYTWPNGAHLSLVTFELTPHGGDVRLVLTHSRLKDMAEMKNVSSGWHAHLMALEGLLSGRDATGFWTNFLRLEKEYDKVLGG